MYDGALKALAQAKGCIGCKDIEAHTGLLNKAVGISFGLRDCLELNKGGEISANLENLYQYMIRTIIDANREQDAEKVQHVMNLILDIKAGWAGMPLDIRTGKSKR